MTTNGRFQPCERTGDLLELGNLDTGISGPAVRGLQDQFFKAVQDRCGGCFALRMCGVCFAVQAEQADPATNVFPVPETVCENVRRNLERTMKMMVRIIQMPPEAKSYLDDTAVV